MEMPEQPERTMEENSFCDGLTDELISWRHESCLLGDVCKSLVTDTAGVRIVGICALHGPNRVGCRIRVHREHFSLLRIKREMPEFKS
jgi:hypothetical protein